MQAENNVAAQAGDEPMREAFEAWCLEERNDLSFLTTENGNKHYCSTFTSTAWRVWQAAQVSPRATADVERNQAVRDLVRLWDCEVFHPDEYNEEMCRIEAIIRATTKPGA